MSMLGRQSPDERDDRLGGSRSATGPSRKEENVYIPQFITKRPFYAINEEEESASAAADSAAEGTANITRSGSRDYLEHQRLRKTEQDSKWYQRGKNAGPVATKYRKGACENCGSMSHAKRDCFHRPRARLAKYTGEDIQADELVEDVKLSWDAKRDRWLGFDPRDYAGMMAQRERMNEARRVLVEKATAAGGGGGSSSGGTGDKSRDGAEAGDGGALVKAAGDDGTRYTEDTELGVSRKNGAADLRMREDTARYLVNLDVDSAKYDPKRRKIVDGGAFLDDSARLFAEENFAKASGDAEAFEKAERYAWEVHDKTGDASLHMQANPTAAAHRRKLDQEEARRKQKEMDDLMREKYGVAPSDAIPGLDEKESSSGSGGGGGGGGGQVPLAAKKKAALLATAVASSEHFVEYDESGHVKDKYQAKRADRSKYAEDVFPLNHTSVWGSWWSNFQWGYACCHSFVRNSYCTGADGKAAWERAERQRLGDWGDNDEKDEKDEEADSGRGERRMLKEAGDEGDAPSDDDQRRRDSSPPRKRKKERSSRDD
ncbi:pre-mRNA-processing factor SLU7 [Sporothrix schenckii 1099-18]|uniref:Pre-mRNA-splicing factor SLU7 n=1 Tax=Sporothrix schenckii 1099-18 TaxID=1397361 RepID=A0A0F2MNB5_SPOSC|nr:pre-mRNA-processing factor SLU7 [Sporothrix schenckii 1099-18]KJR89671.1 pre-mRNA-processing factor SLU7 [Sporothrix schenckii 1099-18]